MSVKTTEKRFWRGNSFFFIGIKGRQKNKQYIVEPDEKINQENRSKKKRFYEKTVYKYLKKKMTKRLERGLKK